MLRLHRESTEFRDIGGSCSLPELLKRDPFNDSISEKMTSSKKKQPETIGDWREIDFALNAYNPCVDCGAYKAKMMFKTVKADFFVRSICKCLECFNKF